MNTLPIAMPTLSPILSVDDDGQMRRLIDRSLRSEGYTTEGCSSAESALKVLRAGSRYSLLLLDVQMEGESGFDLARRLREGEGGERNRDIPIVFVTGEGDVDSFEKSFDVGAHVYVLKPFTQEQLLEAVESALHG